MYMFHVAKGDNIFMVYDSSKLGLNAAIYAPWFPLLTAESMTRWLTVGSWLADNDYGKCFLDFFLHPDLGKYCRVGLAWLFPDMCDVEACMVVRVWLCCAMRLRSSPYNVIQGALVAKQFVLGDPNDSKNAFQWSSISENLPFSTTYNMSEPKLRKWRLVGMTASEIAQYVDDLRLIAAKKDLAWQAGSQVAKGLCWLCLKDAVCKR